MTTLKKVEIKATVEVSMDFYPEDFEGSSTTWEEFLKECESEEFLRETLADNLLDDRKGTADDIIKQLLEKQVPVTGYLTSSLTDLV